MKTLRGDGPGARTRRLSAALVALATTFLFTVPAKADAHEVLGHWPLNEGSGQATADASAKGHTGTLGASSGPDSNDPSWIPGRFGQGLRFLGDENQYVGIARPQTLSPKLITVEAWIRRQGSPGQWRYIVSNGGQECDFASFGLYTAYTGGLAFYVSNGVKFIRSPTAPPGSAWDGAWHYAVGTYDGQHVRFYLDGVQILDGSATKLTISYALEKGDVYLGSYRASCDRPFTGDVDEVKIRDGALSPEQIAGNASAAGLQPPPPQLPPVSGPPAGKPRACFKVRVTPGKLVAKKRTRLRIRVRRGGRAAARKRVMLRGVGTRKSVRTGPKGRVRLHVRPRRRGRLKVKVAGQPRRCPAAYRVKVRPKR